MVVLWTKFSKKNFIFHVLYAVYDFYKNFLSESKLPKNTENLIKYTKIAHVIHQEIYLFYLNMP